ncbi:hypothetical protein Q7W11_10145 [Streptococcus suis]|nr:hypothetical protein [Streptococcus suis]
MSETRTYFENLPEKEAEQTGDVVEVSVTDMLSRTTPNVNPSLNVRPWKNLPHQYTVHF